MATALEIAILLTARNDASRVLSDVHSAFGALGSIAATAGVGMAAGLGLGVKSAGDLQQAVANISTIKPDIDTSGVFASLNEISTRVPQTATQLGDALYNIFSSVDVSQQQALGLVETFAKGAVGASTDAQTFGTAALGVLNAYGLQAEDATHISDVFFNTVNKGVITGDQLAANLGMVTQSAKLAGVDLDSLGGFIAGVTKEGGDAAANVNNLNNLFLKINTGPAQQAFHDLGIATTDTTGKFRPQIDVLSDLKAATEGMTEAAKVAAIQKIFPDLQARAGALVIMDQLDFVKQAIAENAADAGSAEQAYAKMSATFNSQTALLGNAFNAMLTTIGAEVLPGITPIITGFAQTLPAAMKAARDAFGNFAMGLKDQLGASLQSVADKLAETGKAWAPWAAQAGPAGIIVGDMLSGVSGVVQSLQLLLQGNFTAATATAVDALTKFASPADMVGAAVATLQSQFVAFAPTGERIGKAFDAIVTAGASLVASAQSLVAQFEQSGIAAQASSGSFDGLVAAVNGVSAGFESVTTFIQDNVAAQAALVAGLTAAATIFGLVTTAALANAVATTGVAVATGIYTSAQWLLNAALTANPIGLVIVALAALAAGLIYAYQNSEQFRTVVNAVFASVMAAAVLMLDFVRSLPATIGGALATAGALFSTFGSNVQAVLATVGGLFSSIGTQIQAGLAGIGVFFSGLGSLLSNGLDAVGSTIGGFFRDLGTTIHDDLAFIANLFASVWNAIPEDIRADLAIVIGLIGDHFSTLGANVQAGMATIVDEINTGWTAVASTIGTAMTAIGNVVDAGWNAISASVTNALSALETTISTAWDAITVAAGVAVTAVGTVVDAGWQALSASVGVALNALITTIQTGWDTITNAASAAWNGVSTAIGTALDAALTVVRGWLSDVVSALSGLADGMRSAGAAAGQAAVDGLTAALTSGIRAVGDAAASLAREALNAAKNSLGPPPASPWPAFVDLGSKIPEGLIVGIQGGTQGVADAMAGSVRTAMNTMAQRGGGFLTVPQFGSAIRALGFNEATIEAICGPIAAQGISEGLGKSISLIDVESIASKIGAYARGAGTFGSGAFEKILSAIGIDSRTASFNEAVDAAMKGIPVAISTPLHYFLAQGFDSATQQFIVGNTGTALKAGAEKMTAAAIEGVAGAATYIIPSLKDAGQAVSDLSTDIATGFTSVAAPATAGLSDTLDGLVKDIDSQGTTMASKMADIATTVSTAIGKATTDGAKQIADDMRQAQDQLDRLGGSLADQTSIAVKQTGLEGQIAQERALHQQQRADADSLYAHQQDLAKAAVQLDKDLAKARTDVDRARIQQAYQDQIAGLNTNYAQKLADTARNRALDVSDRQFDAAENDKLVAFKQAAIIAERDAKIAAAQQATAGQIVAAQDEANKERAVQNESYATHIADIKAKLLNLLPGLVGDEATRVQGILDGLTSRVASSTSGVVGSIGDVASATAHAGSSAEVMASSLGISFDQASAIIADHGAKAKAILGTTIPDGYALTDQAVESFANAFGLSWDQARVALEAGGDTADAVMGKQVPAALNGAITSAQDFAAATGVSFGQATQILNDHGVAATKILGDTIPTGYALTDTAIEAFAATFSVSWDQARTILTAGGAVADAVMGKQIPDASQKTVDALSAVGHPALWDTIVSNAAIAGKSLVQYLAETGAPAIDTASASLDELVKASGLSLPQIQAQAGAAGKDIKLWLADTAVPAAQGLSLALGQEGLTGAVGGLTKPIDDATGAAKSLASDGLDVAKGATEDLGGTMGTVAKDQATQIAAVLLNLRDGLLGLKDYASKGLIQAIKDFTDSLIAIPNDIKVNITTNYSSTGANAPDSGTAGQTDFAQSGIPEGTSRTGTPAPPAASGGDVSPYPDHIGESGPGGIYNDPATGKPYTRAAGGPIRPGQPYLVGEHGPELIMPNLAGMVHSASATVAIATALSGKSAWPSDAVLAQMRASLDRLPSAQDVAKAASAPPGHSASSEINIHSTYTPRQSGPVAAPAIDYDRLGAAVANAMQSAPAPRVAIEDIRSSLARIGRRNGGAIISTT